MSFIEGNNSNDIRSTSNHRSVPNALNLNLANKRRFSPASKLKWE